MPGTVPKPLAIPPSRRDEGFTILELLVTMGIVLLVVGASMTGVNQIATSQRTIWNRTEMHSGVRGATELLQQEVGQAGRIALPAPATLTGAVAIGTATVSVSSAAGMYVGEQLIIDGSDKEETVATTAVDTVNNTITAAFTIAHAAGSPINVFGGFASGIAPPSMANGSTASVLKMYGDINGDGKMVYIEYTCDTAGHNLYRNSAAWNAAAKPALSPAQILLANIVANPGGAPCFTYQTAVVGPDTYVTDVAVTLTVQTQQVDPITQQFQLETKALLNVSPRNIFNTWELASIGLADRVQPMPPSIQNLLP